MLKVYIIVLFLAVICSHSILINAIEDDFAEFDDLIPDEKDSLISDNVKKQSDIKEPSPVIVDSGSKSDLEADKSSPRSKADDDSTEDSEGKSPNLKLVDAPLPGINKWESYYVEIAFLFASFLYFICFFIGSSKNHKFAHEWYESTRDLLKQQFALVGGSPQINDGHKKGDEEAESINTLKKQKGLIKVSESVYTLWNSGRVGVDGLLIEVNLLKRQDLFSMALNLLRVQKDSLILRFILPQEGYENFVFCIAHKSHATKLARDMVDINTFCPKKKPLSQLGVDVGRLFAMSELTDVLSFVLDPSTVRFLKNHERSVNYIHITDQYSTVRSDEVTPMLRLANPKRMATFSFSLPMKSSERAEFVLFALSLLDRLRRFKLARDSKQKSDKNRHKITDFLQKMAFSQRQEAAQAKKEELRRLEKERIIQEDDPEKQRKWEKKEAKRELKKNKGRVKHLKIRSS